MAGINRIKFGDKLKRSGIQKYKGNQDAPSILAIINRDDCLEANIHYENGIGYFYCFEGECCQNNNFPKAKMIMPIVQYSVTDYSTFAHGGPVVIKYLSLSEEQYKELQQQEAVACAGTNKTLSDFDILVSCKNNQFQNLSFQLFTNQPPFWRQDPVLLREVTKEYNEKYVPLIEQSLARYITLEDYRKARASAIAQAGGAVPQNSPAVPSPPPSFGPPAAPGIGYVPGGVGVPGMSVPGMGVPQPHQEIVETAVSISDLMDPVGSTKPQVGAPTPAFSPVPATHAPLTPPPVVPSIPAEAAHGLDG
jgi:hypothetical protein